MNMELKPTDGFGKLQFLLQQNPFPPETFGNLLLLYCKYEYYDLAADVLAENAHLTYKYLTPYLYDFLEALITQVKNDLQCSLRLINFHSKRRLTRLTASLTRSPANTPSSCGSSPSRCRRRAAATTTRL